MKKNIAFLINSLGTGGAETIFETITNGFVINGIYPHILLLENKNEYHIDNRCRIIYLTSYKNIPHLFKLILLPYYAYKLNNYCIKHNIDVVISHLYRSNYVNILSNFKKRRKTILVNQGTVSRYKVEGVLGFVNLFLIKHLYKRADKIILSSQGMLSDMQNLFNFKTNIDIIFNPNNINDIYKKSQDSTDLFVFRKNIKYITFVGRLVPLKRIDLIINALVKLRERNFNVELIIIGEGSEYQKLINLADQQNVKNYIHFLGRLENPFKYIAKSDALILASESEGLGNVIIESLACKCPVVSSDCNNGPREILAPSSDVTFRLDHGIEVAQYGILFSNGNSEALIDAIILILSDSKLQLYYKNAAIERTKAFDNEEIIRKFIDLC